MSSYPFKEIEFKWRRIWEERGDYKINLDDWQKKLYCLVMFSYPSALKLHIGHWYNFAPTDTWARFKKMQGFNVFEPTGYDAFGLPAENYAVRKGVHPKITTEESIVHIRKQLREIGAMYDWSKEVNTSRPDYYKWTQWLFLLLYKRGLAYQKQAPVNWCPQCQTVLANEQVVGNGECERCGTRLSKRNLKQWFFKITAYADRLLEGLNRLDWPKKSIAQQTYWIGRSEGANIRFPLIGSNKYIETFTTRADTLFGVTHLVLAPENPYVTSLTTPEHRAEVEKYILETQKVSDIERESLTRTKTGVFLGSYALNPLSGEKTPVWIADYVLATYGTGAVMAVPAHDQRDFEFASKYRIPIKVVIQDPSNSLKAEEMTSAYTDYGVMVASGEFNGLNSGKGMKEVAERLSAIGQGSVAVTYHLHDWLISRQRFWGAPIPIIHCDNCGTVPVPEKELPVLLPEGDIDFKPKGKSPLAMVEEFIKVRCPKCGEEAQRDADTMDTFVCSSWYYFRYLCANMQDKPFDSAILNRWMPVDQYVGGSEHINGHLLYSRFICKVLYDEGLINFEEPFTALRHQGIITNKGAKMSKSKGNVVNPETFTHKFGSDVFRLYMMFMGDYEQGGDWSDEGIIGVERFVNRIWRLYQEHWPVPENKNEVKVEPELLRILHYTIKSVGEDIPNFKFNTAISRIMELVNGLYNHFGSKPVESLDSNFLKQSFKSLPLIIAPLAPHLGEELWSIVSGEGSVFNQSWPKYDPSALNVDTIEIALQVNGKMRGTMTITRGSEESKVFEQAESLPGIAKYLVEKSILRKIYIKDKLLNIVAK